MNFTGKEKPITVGINPKSQELQTKKTYFYEMPSGKIEAVEEREAWQLQKTGAKQVGVSDGQLFAKANMEARELFNTEGLEAAQERIRKGFDEELEAARGHFERPPDYGTFGNGANHFRQTVGKFK